MYSICQGFVKYSADVMLIDAGVGNIVGRRRLRPRRLSLAEFPGTNSGSTVCIDNHSFQLSTPMIAMATTKVEIGQDENFLPFVIKP
jgi:hypothetical protein